MATEGCGDADEASVLLTWRIMAVTKAPEQFKTSDGQKFDTIEEAERHEVLITAREQYNQGRRAFNRALAMTQKTADGELFDFGIFRDYYYITPGWSGCPALQAVNFLGWNYEVEDNDDVKISKERDSDRQRISYPIKDLYRHKRKAEIALVAAQEAWLAEQAAEIAANKEATMKPST